ncbi:MAG TPA: MFS transporter, partial [Chloroflexota bacterium]|nr:MFS transporter [Chloroflexota bacterium]
MAPGSLYAVWAWLFVCLGLCIAVLGPSIPAFRDEFSVSLATAGALFTVHSVGYFGGVLLAGPLADRRGRRPVAALGAAGLLAGTALAALAPEWGWFLAAMIPSGFGFAFVDVGLNAAIGDAVLDPRRRAAVMNLLHGAFPLGTLAAPAGLALAWQLGLDWRATFLAIAALVALALIPLVVGGPKWPKHDTSGNAPTARTREGVMLVPSQKATNVLSLLREPFLARLAL